MLEGAVQAAVEGRTLTLTFPRESLGDPERMMFVVIAEQEIGNAEEGGVRTSTPMTTGPGLSPRSPGPSRRSEGRT